MNESALIAEHYAKVLGAEGMPTTWKLGTQGRMPSTFEVLVFEPTSTRAAWTYATNGMSQQHDGVAVELHLFSPIKTGSHVELLTALAHYHLTGEYLDLGHTVNFGRPWLPGSRCDRGLISLPYLDGPQLEWIEADSRRIRFLWLIPVTAIEVEFKEANGLEALEERFESSSFNYLDPTRESVV